MLCFFFFFFNDTATTEIYTLSLHDALPISRYLGGFPQSVPQGLPPRSSLCLLQREAGYFMPPWTLAPGQALSPAPTACPARAPSRTARACRPAAGRVLSTPRARGCGRGGRG